MKKTIIISFVLLVAISLTAFGIISWNDSETIQLETSENIVEVVNSPAKAKMEKRIYTDFVYDVGTRFNPITKSDLEALRSFNDIIGNEHAQRIESYKSLRIYNMINDKQSYDYVGGPTDSDLFNAEQLKFLQDCKYSKDLKIWADYIERNPETGEITEEHWTPHLTVVPEKQAEYIDNKDPVIPESGKHALMNYLKSNIKDHLTDVDPEKLKPAKLFFTVTKNGTIENAKLDRPSGYPLVDKKMIELMSKTSGIWKPAENEKGEKVDQVLVVSFGLKGC